jgi:uncharacterized damage-inducible protein DinB
MMMNFDKMSERQRLQQLFMFDLWCTRKLTDLIIKNEKFKQRTACAAFLSHIIIAQKIWYSRVTGQTTDLDLDHWMEYEISDLKSKAKKSIQKWMELIGDHDVHPDRVVQYQNSKGVEYQNTVWEICQHLIIHGQYHRAQISLLLRNSDIEPPNIDFINYVRFDEIQTKTIH